VFQFRGMGSLGSLDLFFVSDKCTCRAGNTYALGSLKAWILSHGVSWSVQVGRDVPRGTFFSLICECNSFSV
jgi:hypothetical protein